MALDTILVFPPVAKSTKNETAREERARTAAWKERVIVVVVVVLCCCRGWFGDPCGIFVVRFIGNAIVSLQ